MLYVISPAKSLDYDTPTPPELAALASRPQFVPQAAELIGILKTKSPADIGGLMDISDALSTLNVARYHAWSTRFTDKNLATWKHIGAALAMLHGSRVVVVRRDPLETCVACYRQWFAGSTDFACDLDELADYYADFMRLTRFWLEKYPTRVFDLPYESLVAEPESVTRRLLDFCGLPFDAACLEFHQTSRTVLSSPSAAQVRQPMRRDTARSALYGDKLNHLRQRLRDAGVLLG